MRIIRPRLLECALLPCLLFLAGLSTQAETNPRLYAVEVSATVQAAPAQIRLQWPADANATGYNIYRKAPTAASWTHLTSVAGLTTTWADGNVANGSSYEYAITKSTSLGYQGTGYILTGINAPMTENRGKMVLIVDNTHAAALAGELTRLQQDLVGDGWTVIRQDVARTATAPQVKQLIQNAYNADPANVKSVFLFGHVAVPYSGNYNPDGHPDHKGAWTADTYYGDMDGTWTDSSVNNSGAEKAWNHNTPGDGKFDQSDLPSDVELAVGRVDLYNMTCYSNKAWSRSELDLLRAYLNKDHNFRHGRMVVPRRGLVCDNFGEMGGEAFASTGWRSFASFFGAQNNVQVPYGQYFSTLRDNGYLWSYGTGGGSWYTCNGIGGSDDFANTEIKTVFTAFLGSYFGDWDNESAFLRAPLGSGWALASVWGGRPHWFFHPMGLGETIGTATKLSQNNRYGGLYSRQNWGTRQVHVTLLGDPSLRMHPVIPPASVAVNGGTVTWAASTDSAIQGYNVYRAPSVNGPFTRVNGTSLVTSLFFTDAAPVSGSVYMVRAVKLEQSGSGTYLNLSQGILSAGSVVSNPTPTPTPVAPKPPTSLSGSALSSSEIRIQWTDNSSDESGFRILRKAGVSGAYATIAVGANTVAYTDSSLSAGTQYFYKVHAYNAVGNSAESAEINVSTSAAPATPPSTSGATSAVFLQSDTATRGAWKGFYGAEG
ncbi:MAG: fibronectin type III domain-containing protein, partial [Limisphaerales bacterium]